MIYSNSSRLKINEVTVGLVLHLNPDVLLAQGGYCSCTEDRRVRGNHWFVCVSVVGAQAQWCPLYSRDGIGRFALPAAGRSGHPNWVSSRCFFHPAQVWSASFEAVRAAALAGNDLSTRQCRNRIAPGLLPSQHQAA